MKSKYWIALLAVLLVGCVILSVAVMNGTPAVWAQVSSGGEVVQVLDLRVDQELTVYYDGRANVITVRGGKIAVTDADCPDQLCVKRGFCSSGAQIVCLPNRLVISFLGTQEIDGVSG